MTTQRRFYVAGWVTVLGAVAMIPSIGLSVAMVFFPKHALLQAVNDGWSVVTAALGVYVLLALKRLLHARDFHAADFVMTLLVTGLIVGVMLEVGGGLMPDTSLADTLLVVYAVAIGMVSAVLGYQILPAVDRIPGPMKLFAQFTIVSGICLATLILMPIGFVTSIAADLSLAIVFFRMSEAAAEESGA